MEIQKAKIVELNANYAVVLTDSGAFKRVVRKGEMSVGSGIYITDQDLYLKARSSLSLKLPVFSKRFLQLTGVVALLFTILFTQNFSPLSYAVISVDINPSIQLFIDADYNVVKIESMNKDGKNLLSKYDFIKKKSASSVLTELFTLASEMDYLKLDQNEILIAAAIFDSSKKSENMLLTDSDANKVIDAVLSAVDYSIFKQKNVVINAVASNAKNIKAAGKERVTIGQYEKDYHPDAVKTYAIVEGGKPIKGNRENVDMPEDTSNEELDDDDTNNGDNNNNEKNNDNNGNKNHSKDKTRSNYGIDKIRNNVENNKFLYEKNVKRYKPETEVELKEDDQDDEDKSDNQDNQDDQDDQDDQDESDGDNNDDGADNNSDNNSPDHKKGN